MVQYPSVLRRFRIVGIALIASVACASTANAQIISSLVVQSGTNFIYRFGVRNNTTDSLADVTLNLPNPITLVSLVAPSGFSTTVDGGTPPTTFVDFFPNVGAGTDFLPGQTVDGFGFTSTTNLGSSISYSVLSSNGNTVTGTTAPTTGVAPEASALNLALLGGIGMGFVALRRRSAIKSVK